MADATDQNLPGKPPSPEAEVASTADESTESYNNNSDCVNLQQTIYGTKESLFCVLFILLDRNEDEPGYITF